MRHVLATATVAILLVVSGGAVGAQEARPEPEASPTPEQLAAAEEWLAIATCLGTPATMVAIPGFETIGTSGPDVIVGTEDDDIIRGEGGNDRICGGPGADLIEGGAGKDRIDGGLGDDRLDGGASDDIIIGGKGADTITGAGGKDRLTGAAGDDSLDGGKGKDVCVGGEGTDWLPGCNEAKRTQGTVIVKKNLKLEGPHKGRFIIGKNGVTLDCDGHTVTGPGRKFGLPGVGLSDRKRVTVRNCDIRNHQAGFDLWRSHRNRLLDNRVSGSSNGFSLRRSDSNNLAGNTVLRVNDSSGFVIAEGSDQNRLVGNVAERAVGDGFVIDSSSDNELVDNVARHGMKIPGIGWSGNGFGVYGTALGNSFTGNSAIENARIGFLDTTHGFTGYGITDNHYEGNYCAGNGEVDEPSSPMGLCEDG